MQNLSPSVIDQKVKAVSLCNGESKDCWDRSGDLRSALEILLEKGPEFYCNLYDSCAKARFSHQKRAVVVPRFFAESRDCRDCLANAIAIRKVMTPKNLATFSEKITTDCFKGALRCFEDAAERIELLELAMEPGPEFACMRLGKCELKTSAVSPDQVFDILKTN